MEKEKETVVVLALMSVIRELQETVKRLEDRIIELEDSSHNAPEID